MKRMIIRIIKVLAWAVLAISILLFSLLYYIGIHATPVEVSEEGIEPDSICNTPQCVIYLQPYENFTSEEANKLKPVLQEKFGSFLYGHWEFEVLPTKKLPSTTYIKDIDRYRATAILVTSCLSLCDLEKRNIRPKGPRRWTCRYGGLFFLKKITISWGWCLIFQKTLKDLSPREL